MWQRIQTIFLGLVILSLAGTMLLPIMEGVNAEGVMYVLYPVHMMQKAATGSADENVYNYFPFCVTAVFVVAALTVAIISIRRFDDRILQMKLSMLNSLLLVASMICAVVFITMLKNKYAFVDMKNDLSLYFLFGAVVFNWIALRFIRRDEKLVRDSDRLR